MQCRKLEVHAENGSWEKKAIFFADFSSGIRVRCSLSAKDKARLQVEAWERGELVVNLLV